MTRTRTEIERQMADAKARFTQAAKAALAGDPNAPDLARAAYQDVEFARAALAAIAERSL